MSKKENRCSVCGEDAIHTKITRNYEYRTPMGIVTIEGSSKFEECGNCKEALIPGKLIDEWNLLVLKQLSQSRNLFSPLEIQFIFSVLPYSQNEIAKAAGRERSTLTKYKTGENEIDVLFDDLLKQIIVDHLAGQEDTLIRLRSRSQFVSKGETVKKLKAQ